MKQDELCEVELSKIRTNPFQPRRVFSESEIEELAQSLKAVGLIHPPLVRPVGADYELVAGERRYRAAIAAGFKKIPVVIRHSTVAISAEAALIENVQRVDLNPIEIAKALKNLMQEFGLSQDDLAIRIGKKRSTVANYLRLLTLSPYMQAQLVGGAMTMGHAKALLALETEDQRRLLLERIVRDDLTVREAEQAALRIREKGGRQALTYEQTDFFLQQLSEKVQQLLGTKVCIQGKGKRGRIFIDYYSLDDLDRLLKLFGLGGSCDA